ncbi:CHASE2 domain-containing protein [Acidovorax sp. sic0104]|nr:serine/threonine-protein kinase [Acidovorax sp. sic0104]MBV7541520.1 CHASE2 domain-containing protein [Acidovorax sp. sic0104]
MAAAATALLAASGTVTQLENRLYDTAVSTSSQPPLAEIAIVGIDDASIKALGPQPWARDVYAQVVDRLAAAGAKTIVLTDPFFEPQSDRGLAHVRKIREALARSGDTSAAAVEIARLGAEAESSLDTDARLAASMERAGNVFLVSRYTPAHTGAVPPLPPFAQRSALQDPGALAASAAMGQHPIETLGAVAAGVGHLATEADADGVVRQVPMLLRHGQSAMPSLAVLAARHSLHLGPGQVRVDGGATGLRLGGLHVATDALARLRPRFPAPGEGAASAFPLTSLTHVIQGRFAPGSVKDKIVLVGAMSDALAASLALPGGHSAYPVEVLAHVISAIRQGHSVERPAWAGAMPWGSALAALLLAALVLAWFPRRTAWVITGGLAVALVGLEWGLLRYTGSWVPMLSGAAALLLAALAFVALGLRGSAGSAQSSEAAETDRMMGLALQGQGQLDMAFERLRKVPPSDALLDNLYHLAQDFERKRDLAKAKAVYKHLLQHNREYKDARSRYKKVRAQLQAADAPASTPSGAPSSLPPQMPRLPGDAGSVIPMLGRYQIVKEIGKGAMGVVYQGRDPKIGRVVAIKTLALSEEFEGDALVDARARFFREAETAGRLQHPHIVTIFDAGEEHDLAYIAMEFLKGTDLADACRPDQLLPVATVLSIAGRVAQALDYAHAHQVVHRDIKPANIMYDSATDTVKVTDFGIARITDSSKTRTGLVLGTPSFMSPEQLAGKKVDGRSDLYSLGVALFQLLTGSLPLRGESMTELMHKIANVEAPDVRQLRPDLTQAVASVVATALHKRPEARYQTGRQFAEDLHRAGFGAGQTGAAQAGAVVYDADRDATGHEMVDFQETVMEPPAGRGAASPPISSAR